MTVDYTIKIISLGDGAVGKTALIRRYPRNIFDPEYAMTIGVNLSLKTVEISTEKGMKLVKLQLSDFEGQEVYRFMLPIHIKGANGAMLAFDLTRRVTFENLPEWIAIVRDNLNYYVPILLMGNKVDLKELREVSRGEAIEFAKKAECSAYVETSAKTGENVQTSFEVLTEQSLEVEWR